MFLLPIEFTSTEVKDKENTREKENILLDEETSEDSLEYFIDQITDIDHFENVHERHKREKERSIRSTKISRK